MPTDRTEFLDIDFDVLEMPEILEQLAATSPESRYGYVVTPNVDHVVRLHEQGDARLWQIYRDAKYCTCDSRILQTLAKVCGVTLPVVAGSDLTALTFEHIFADGDRIGIIGGDEALLDQLKDKYPKVIFVQHVPPMGLLTNLKAIDEAAAFIAHARARFTFIAVGSPQQELVAARALSIPGSAGMAFCIGASIDFLVGRQARAPKMLQGLRLEWAHRLASNPAQMWRRYIAEGPKIFLLAYRWKRAVRS